MGKAALLRELFRKQGIVRIVGAHNGMTAKLVENNGFEGIWASGLEVSTSHAVPDANILTMSDHLNACISMNDATSIPVISDCDTGYGNSNNVIQMVKKFEAADIAGVCIEDKLFPKVNSFIPGRQELAPIAEFVGKIIAAKNAQRDKDFMIFARVEALIAGWGLDEALKRARAYVKAGADGIFIHSKKNDPSEILSFINQWDEMIPLIVCPTMYPQLDIATIEKLKKVKMVIYANHGIRAAIKAINETLSKINQDKSTIHIENTIATMKEVFDIQGMSQMKASEKLYLKTGMDIKAIIPVAGDASKIEGFEKILGDMPLAMLDINGKPLLQRIVETLNNSKIQDICVVTGYQGDKVTVDGIEKIHNPQYNTKGILHSVMSAQEKMTGKTLLTFGDFLFDSDIVAKLIESNDDFVLVIDSSYKTHQIRNKKLDLVKATLDPLVGDRIIRPARDNQILKIGKNLSPNEANYEFIGMAMLSENGTKILKDEYSHLLKEHSGPFYESESFEKADILDMFSLLIEKGHLVKALEIHKGWMEVNSFDGYKRVCEVFKGQ